MTSDELYQRLLSFAKLTQRYLKQIPITLYTRDSISQLARSSSSPGANYIEALEASSRKDFSYRLKICRKETKESIHWLELLKSENQNMSLNKENAKLISEARELIRIFTATILTTERNNKLKN